MNVLKIVEFAKGKGLEVQAELAVAYTLNDLRQTKGLFAQVVKAFDDDKHEATHVGSYFYTTEQMNCSHYDNEKFHNREAGKFNRLNIVDDIDLALTSVYKVVADDNRIHTKTYGVGATVSVKKQDRALETGNIGLELSTYSNRTGESRKGWFETSKADYYAFVVGTVLIMVKKADLVRLSREKEWRVSKGLSKAVMSTNVGRKFDNASNLLIPVEEVARIGTVFPIASWYAKKWKVSADKCDKVANDKLASRLFKGEF